jgi:hypothetical protein
MDGKLANLHDEAPLQMIAQNSRDYPRDKEPFLKAEYRE